MHDQTLGAGWVRCPARCSAARDCRAGLLGPRSRGRPGRRGGPRLTRPPGSGYGVMAMASGPFPTLMGRPALLVAVLTGVTVFESPFTT
jgi:hypothetical protein